MKVVQAELPEGVYAGGISEAKGGLESVERAHAGLDLDDFPSFYGKAGEIEGCFAALGRCWCDGELGLVIKKGKYSFEGTLTNYDDEAVIGDLIQKIEGLAGEFCTLFQEASSYTVTFKFSSRLELNEKGREHLSRH